MTEHDDVAEANPDVVRSLLRWVDQLASEYHPPVKNPRVDLDGYCAAVQASVAIYRTHVSCFAVCQVARVKPQRLLRRDSRFTREIRGEKCRTASKQSPPR